MGVTVDTERASARGAGAGWTGVRRGRHKPFSSLVPAIIGSALLMQTLNATSINNALPPWPGRCTSSPLRLNLAITMYLLASAVFLPISGWVADRFGAKRIFMVAMVLFAAASAACGFAQNLPQLIVARLFQGCAGAMMGPVGRLVLLRTTPKHELVRRHVGVDHAGAAGPGDRARRWAAPSSPSSTGAGSSSSTCRSRSSACCWSAPSCPT